MNNIKFAHGYLLKPELLLQSRFNDQCHYLNMAL